MVRRRACARSLCLAGRDNPPTRRLAGRPRRPSECLPTCTPYTRKHHGAPLAAGRPGAMLLPLCACVILRTGTTTPQRTRQHAQPRRSWPAANHRSLFFKGPPFPAAPLGGPEGQSCEASQRRASGQQLSRRQCLDWMEVAAGIPRIPSLLDLAWCERSAVRPLQRRRRRRRRRHVRQTHAVIALAWPTPRPHPSQRREPDSGCGMSRTPANGGRRLSVLIGLPHPGPL